MGDDVSIQDLRREAKRLGLSGAGSKDDLRERIIRELEPTTGDNVEHVGEQVDVEPSAGYPEVEGAVALADETPDVVDGPRPDALPVERIGQNGAWWCPFCDHSNHHKMRECGNCRATRNENNEVTR